MTRSLSEALRDWHESITRAGVVGRSGWANVISFRKELGVYFARLAAAVDLGNLQPGDYALIEPHLTSLISQAQPALLDAYMRHAKKAYAMGWGQSLFAEADSREELTTSYIQNLYAQLDHVGLSTTAQIAYIQAHGAELVKGIDATTRKVINDAITKGVAEQLGAPGTVREIIAQLGDMKRSRAKSIANTELNDAMSQATLDKLSDVGTKYKRWIARPGACPMCQTNAAAGAIPIDAAFPSGHLRPPGHPGKCRCALAGVVEELLYKYPARKLDNAILAKAAKLSSYQSKSVVRQQEINKNG